MTQASGKIPQISVVLGPAAGGAAYGPALTDVVILGPEGRIFVTGPDVVRSVTGEDVDMLRLGGPEPHGRRSGVVHITHRHRGRRLERARRSDLLANQGTLDGRLRTSTCPACCRSRPSARTTSIRWSRGARRGHLRRAARALGAEHRHRRSAGSVAHGRRDRQQPAALGGCLDSPVGGEGVPVRADVRRVRRPARRARRRPGYLPGVGQEWDGVVRRGAKLLHAFAEAVVPGSRW
jgi:acetyl-CoA/propionyl-CoA carboxylase carboxyl transferase subunit